MQFLQDVSQYMFQTAVDLWPEILVTLGMTATFALMITSATTMFADNNYPEEEDSK